MRNASLSPPTFDESATGTRLAQNQEWLWLSKTSAKLSGQSARPPSLHQAEQFARSYRAATTHLARLKAFSPDRSYTGKIEQIVAVAHLALYRRPWVRFLDLFFSFLFTIPRLIVRHWPYHVMALAITLLSAMVAFYAVWYQPGWFDLFIDPSLAGGRGPYASREVLEKSLQGGELNAEKAVFSAFLFTHNTRIALLCFGLGFALGLPTLYLLVMNGLMLGAFVSAYASHGLTYELMGWLLPHGIPEIGAIIICGGAGMMMGHRLLNPGTLSRRDAMVRATREGSLTALCAIPLLAVAGVIEGVFRESSVSTTTRYIMLSVMAVLMAAWLLMGGILERKYHSAPLETSLP